jgi:glycosyltransferase involved in cell wall biosynthesis
MERKGTIIYIGGFEMPDKNAAAHRVLNNAKIFHELGYHVVFCGVDHDITENAKVATKIGSFDNIPAAYPKSNKEWVKQLIDFSHIEKIFNQYSDIKYAIAYNMHAIPLAKLLHYCKKRNVKVVADATEWYENKFSLNPVKLIKCIDTFVVMRYLQKKVDAMIAISSYLEKYYSKHVGKIVVVPPLADLNECIWHVSDIEKEECVEFVYSGSPGPGKDKDKLGEIIEAFGALDEKSEYLFTIIGLTYDQFVKIFPECQKTLLRIKDHICFKGRVSHQESIKALYKADYCIFIRNRSRKNMAGFPTKFVECCTSGINIIANEVSDIARYFPKDGNSYLMKNASIENLKKIIEQKIVCGKDLERVSHEIVNCFDYHNYIELFRKELG